MDNDSCLQAKQPSIRHNDVCGLLRISFVVQRLSDYEPMLIFRTWFVYRPMLSPFVEALVNLDSIGLA